jgi:hypothetical protein
MRVLPRGIFHIFALALPRGHGFGRRPPVGAWESDDGLTFGVLTRDVDTHEHSILVMRQRVDAVWGEVTSENNIGAKDACLAQLVEFLSGDQEPLQLPPGTALRPPLHNVGNRSPSALFEVLAKPTHRVAAWTLKQLYLAMPNPDKIGSVIAKQPIFTRACEKHNYWLVFLSKGCSSLRNIFLPISKSRIDLAAKQLLRPLRPTPQPLIIT